MAKETLIPNGQAALAELIKKAFLFALPYRGRKYLAEKDVQSELITFTNTLLALLAAMTNDDEIIKGFRVREYKVINGSLLEAINVGRVRLFATSTTAAKSLNKFSFESEYLMTPVEFSNFISDLETISGVTIGTSVVCKADIGLSDLAFCFDNEGNLLHIGGDSISPVVSHLLKVDVTDIRSYLNTANYLILTEEELISELFKIG